MPDWIDAQLDGPTFFGGMQKVLICDTRLQIVTPVAP